MKTIILIAMLAGCTDTKPVPPQDAPMPVDAVPETCTKKVTGPTPIGGGNAYCDMSVTITVDCAPGASGHVYALYGEIPSTTLATASLDAAYQCGVPVTATRDGFDCSSSVAADVVWWSPEGVGPTVCN